MTRALTIAFTLQFVVIALLLTLALDVYAHKRVEQFGGVNVWGYRGTTARHKRADEIRLGVVGGTLAFGWGVAAEESMITTVRRLVSLEFDRPGRVVTYVTGYNLGLPGLTHAEYVERVRKYAALDFDVVCVYPDPSAAPARRTLVPRESAIEELTGYTPILPLVLDEKGIPAAGSVLRGIDRAVYALTASGVQGPSDPIEAVLETVADALRAASHGVVVILPPPAAGGSGFESLPARLTSRFGADARLRVVDAASDARLHDPAMRLDGFSFGAGGNAVVGEVASPAVIELLHAGGRSS